MPTAQVHINQLNNIVWNDGRICPFKISNEADVWKISISGNTQYLNKLWHLLSADEQTRANGYYREQDRQRFVISRGYLRVLLSKYLNVTAKSIKYEIDDNKKPYVKARKNGINYNISHSGNYILIGISNSAIGVDVEQIDENTHFDDVMEISFSTDEIAHVKTAKEPLNTFYTLWTRKEALLKATGKGIDDYMKLVPSTQGVHKPISKAIGSNDAWFVNSFDVDEHHSGCVVSIFDTHNFWNISELKSLEEI